MLYRIKKRRGAVDVAPFSAILFIVLGLLTRPIENLGLQAIEKVPDESRNSALCLTYLRFINNPYITLVTLVVFIPKTHYPGRIWASICSSSGYASIV